MYEFLQHDALKQVATQVGFPVKIQIPIGMLIKADACFQKFEFLKASEAPKDLFSLPPECRLVARKEGMKTLTNKKKRLAVANLAV